MPYLVLLTKESTVEKNNSNIAEHIVFENIIYKLHIADVVVQ